MAGRMRVTIEHLDEDLKGSPPLVLEFPDSHIVQERGFFVEGYGPDGRPQGFKPNGQRRARIDLWEGCASYDAFRKDGR
jgi:hypothetical protein